MVATRPDLTKNHSKGLSGVLILQEFTESTESERPLLDRWRLFDNVLEQPRLVADEADGILTVHDAVTLARIEQSANVTLMPPQRPIIVQEAQAAKPDTETRGALRAMRKAWADAVLENLEFGLPVVHADAEGKVMHTPAEEFAPRARRILEVNGDFLPEEQKPSWW